MPETELLLIKTENVPSELLEEAVETAYFAEKLAEAELEANQPNAVWLEGYHFWKENEYVFSVSVTSTMTNYYKMSPLWLNLIYR
jgi:hypothetical protein